MKLFIINTNLMYLFFKNRKADIARNGRVWVHPQPLLRVVSIVLLVVTISCKGVRFSDATVNKPLPETYTSMALYPAGVAGYEFQDLVGSIIQIQDSIRPLQIGLIRPKNYTPKVIPITESNNYYKSRVQRDSDFAATSSFVSFIAKFSEDQMAELTLTDIARAGIVYEPSEVFTEITDSLRVWVKEHPKPIHVKERLWIKEVVLISKIYNDYTKIEANASGQKGDVVGVSTGVYAKNENSTKTVLVAFEARNIDIIVGDLAQVENPAGLLSAGFDKFAGFAKEELDSIFEKNRYSKEIVGKIEFKE